MSRKIYTRPSKEVLAGLLEKHQGAIGAAAEWGCSRTTFRRWAHGYGISLLQYRPGRGGPMRYTIEQMGLTAPGAIPTPVIGPILKKIIDDYEVSPLMSESNRATPYAHGKIYLIFHDNMPEQYKVSGRTVSAIINQERAGIRMDTADRILCWLGHNHLWHQAPLNGYYWEGKPRPRGLDAIVDGLVQMHTESALV